jgi:hypothetical protein
MNIIVQENDGGSMAWKVDLNNAASLGQPARVYLRPTNNLQSLEVTDTTETLEEIVDEMAGLPAPKKYNIKYIHDFCDNL